MEIEWSREELAFRDEVRAFLAANLTDELRAVGKLMTSVYSDHDLSLQWQKTLHEKGWAAPSWPVEYGGCDWTVMQHYIFDSERARAGAPPLSPMGIKMCAPALIAFGTPEQKAFYLPRMLTGEHFWCQGYSEPGSGSDLASLQMSAVEDGDSFVCNGTKIWTTHADVANWIFCLVRTAKLAKPQQGITFLLIPMTTPGITVQPIVSLSGEHIQNQVFFSNVRVPKSNVVGKIGEGWTVAKYVLEFERGGSAYGPGLQARVEEIRAFAASIPGDTTPTLIEDPLFAAKLAALGIRINALEVYELRMLARLSTGGTPGTAASVMKILGTEIQQALGELTLEAAAYYGRAYQPHVARPGGAIAAPQPEHPTKDCMGPLQAALAPLRYLNERAASIYAGSNEIQRNILAKAALGL